MTRSRTTALITAGIETVGFLYWLLEIARGHPVRGLLGFDGILIGEHVVQAWLLIDEIPFWKIVLFSQVETFLVWGLGLAIGRATHLAVALVWWAFGLTVEHTLTDNTLRGHQLTLRVFRWRFLPASALEAAGGFLAVSAFPVSVVLAALAWLVPNAVEHDILDAQIPATR